jgi:hypothetical protein
LSKAKTPSKSKVLTKDVYIFGEPGPHQWFKVSLDSNSPLNLVNFDTVKDLGHEDKIRPYGGKKVRALDTGFWPKGTVSLRFKFHREDAQIYEEEFHVLPSKISKSSGRSTGFDLLICWEWMEAHQNEWLTPNGAAVMRNE